MALQVTSNRLPMAPTININNVYVQIPKDSVAYLPGDASWGFKTFYYLNRDTRNLAKVLAYFVSLSEKPSEWSDTRWAAVQNIKNIQVGLVFAIETHTADDMGVADPTNIDAALAAIYTWVKANNEPTAQDILDDSTLEDLVSAYFLSQGI